MGFSMGVLPMGLLEVPCQEYCMGFSMGGSSYGSSGGFMLGILYVFFGEVGVEV